MRARLLRAHFFSRSHARVCPPAPAGALSRTRALSHTLALALALARAPAHADARSDAGGASARSDAGSARTSVRADAGLVRSDAGLATAPELRAALAQLARTEALSAHFREEKHMALLARPLVSEGTLYYERPRLLARHTERPRRATLLLRGDVLAFGDAEHTESLELASQPALRVLVDTFVHVLAGDLAELERAAELAFELRAGGGFRIQVTPKDAKVKRLVRSLAFEGQGAELSRMELVDANGDTTLTTFTQVTLRKPFSESEHKHLFRVGS